MKQAAAYLRVSTTNQHTDNQRPTIVQLARTRGYEIVRIYEEKASATSKDRKEWERLKRDAHGGSFEAVLINSIDRLGRSMTGNIQDILLLERAGVEVVSAREGWLDTGGPTRQLLIAILSWVAEEEARQIRARVQAGLDRARRQGKQLGRPRKVIPLDAALAMRSQGVSLRKAARQLGVGTTTLQRLYKNHDALPG